MFDRTSRVAGAGRTIAIGSVVAVGAVGLALTIVAAGALGGASPRVEPIVIDTFDGPRASSGDASTNQQHSTTGPTDTAPKQGGGEADSDVTDVRPGDSPGNVRPGPVPTASPPMPRSATTVTGVADETEDVDVDGTTGDDDPDEPDTPEGDNDSDDDD